MSFRPLSGSYISQWDLRFCKLHQVRFRPLSGSYISQLIWKNVQMKKLSFRPLSGSYISQWLNVELNNVESETVSVPYRGATFLNGESCTCRKHVQYVSVPYRGATFLN